MEEFVPGHADGLAPAGYTRRAEILEWWAVSCEAKPSVGKKKSLQNSG